MTVGSKEFYELRRQFEKDLQEMPIYVSSNLTHEKGMEGQSIFYQNGEVNQLFIAYMHGYAFAKYQLL